MNKKKPQIEQLDLKLKGYAAAHQIQVPATGWLKAVRVALGMTFHQQTKCTNG